MQNLLSIVAGTFTVAIIIELYLTLRPTQLPLTVGAHSGGIGYRPGERPGVVASSRAQVCFNDAPVGEASGNLPRHTPAAVFLCEFELREKK